MCYYSYAMIETTDKNINPKKPSKLEEFKLFYEAIDIPKYDFTGNSSSPTHKKSFRDRRISRRR